MIRSPLMNESRGHLSRWCILKYFTIDTNLSFLIRRYTTKVKWYVLTLPDTETDTITTIIGNRCEWGVNVNL